MVHTIPNVELQKYLNKYPLNFVKGYDQTTSLGIDPYPMLQERLQ